MVDEIQEAELGGRHPIRRLLKLVLFAGFMYTVGRFVVRKKNEYAGLTESQAREKMVEKMAPRLGDDTAVDIANQVVPKLKDRGLIKPDPIEEVVDEVEKAAEEVADATEENVAKASDEVTQGIDSAVKD